MYEINSVSLHVYERKQLLYIKINNDLKLYHFAKFNYMTCNKPLA